jgi:PKD repeat protein
MKNVKLLFLFLFVFKFFAFSQTDFGIYPKNNSVFDDTTISFQWNDLGINYEYFLEISTDSLFNTVVFTVNTSQVSSTVNGLLFDKKYYWKVIADDNDESIESSTYNFSTFNIKMSEGINLILTAIKGTIYDADSNLLYWQNIIDPTDSAFQATTSKQPKWIDADTILNDQPVISFDGTDDQLINLNYHKFGAMYVIAKWNGEESVFPTYNGILARYSSGDFPYIFIGNAGTFDIYPSGTPWGLTGVYINQIQTRNFSPLNQHKLLYGRTTNPANFDNLLIGASLNSNRFWKGEIAEIIAFDTIPYDSVKNIINSYLQNKYTPPVNLGNDITVYGFCETSISAYKPWFNSYSWSNGDSDSILSVSLPGKYSITVTDLFGNFSADSLNVYYPSPIQISDTTICLGDSVLWNTELNNDYYFEWFGKLSSDSVIYISQAGEYAFIITDSNGCKFYSDTITIAIDSFPVQNNLGSDLSVCQGEAISLVEESNDIISWSWNNGSNEQFVIVDTAGIYAVHVLNSRGCHSFDTVLFSLSGLAPNVLFEADTICFGDSTSFVNLSSIPEPDLIDSYSWSFGDDSVSSFVNPKHLFQSVDTFVVTLQATANTGCSSLFSDSVIVRHSPTAGFETLFGETQCAGSEIQFIDTSYSNLPISNFSWYFGDGNSSSEQNPNHLFDNSGDYSVSLNIIANNNCSDSASSIISLNDNLPFPTEPELVNPINNYFISNPENIQFEWSDSENAAFYTFEIATDSTFTNIINKQDSLANSNTNYGVSFEGNYLWRVISFNLCGDSTISDIFSLNFTNIANLPDINLWLSASNGIVYDAGSNLLYWQNQIDLSDSAFQSTLSKQPLWIESDPILNNQAVVSFDGIDDQLVNLIYHKFGAMFVIAKWNGEETVFPTYNGIIAKYSSGDFPYIFVGNAGTSDLYPSGIPWLSSDIYINQYQTRNFSPLNSYKLIYGQTENPANFNDLLIGASLNNNRYWKGEIAEIIAFDTIPSDSVKNIINSYFQNKYTPPVNLGQDISAYGFGPVTVDAYKPWFNSYSWSNGETDSVISVSQPGTYSLTVTDIFGNISTDSLIISYSLPNQISDTTICLGDSILWNISLNNDYSFEWHGNSSADSSIYISQEGLYAFIATDSSGYKFYSDTITISIDSFPVLNTLGPDRSVCQGEAVSLVEQSGNIVSWNWNNGSNEQFVIVDTAGIYAVHVLNSRGCHSFDTVLFSLSGLAPNVLFEADTICFGDSTSFVNLSSIPEPDLIDSYSWSFGDDSSSSIISPKHLYQLADTFVVTLQATANTGCSSLFFDSVIVKYRPSAGFETLFGETQCIGSEIQFFDTSFSILSITSYGWNFRDESFAFEPNPTHLFNITGDYQVTLSITADNNCSDSVFSVISINENLALPVEPELLYPNNNYFIGNPEHILFDWSDTENTVFYSFEIAADSAFTNIINKKDSLINSNTYYEVNSEENYFWRVIAFNLCGDSTISDIFSLNFTNIANLPDINLWLSASNGSVYDVDSSLLYWQNIINPADSAFQATTSKQPKWIESDTILNNQPVIYFDGADDQLVNLNYHKFGAMYVIAKWNGGETVFPTYNGILARYSSGDFPYFFIGNAGTSDLYVSGTPWGSSGIFVNQVQKKSFAPINQYKLIYGQTNSPANFNDFLFGSYVQSSGFWKGEIAEIIAFDTIPSDSIKGIVNNYLQNKYAPPINFGEDFSVYGFCETSISAYKPWFTSYSWSNSDSDSIVSVSMPGTYSVTVTDIFGNLSSDSIQVIYPEIISLSDTTICLGDTLTWDTKLKGPYSFVWNNLASDSASAFITAPGEYFVKVTDTLGYFRYSDTITVAVDSFPYSASLGPDTTLCIGNDLYLRNQSELAKAYLWQDGSTFPTFEIQEAGTYWVKVEDTLGCIKYDTITIIINGTAPVPGFYYDQYCINENIVFYDSSKTLDDSEITSWKWIVNNEIQSEVRTFEYTFNQTGNYQVKLEIEADNQCMDFVEKEIHVQPLPLVSFSPLQGCTYVPVNYQNKSVVVGSSIISNIWTFHDNSNITENEASFLYVDPGNYNVQLISESAFGCVDSLTQEIEIKPGPKVDFEVSPACFGEPVYFQNKTETFIGSPTNYIWHFGNDSTSNELNPVVLYDSAGEYRVALYAYQPSNGCTDSTSQSLKIYSNPVAVFENTNACLNDILTLNESSFSAEEEITKWKWNVENILQLEEQNPTFSIPDTGTFTTELIVFSESGCTDTTVGNITIHELPVIDFTINPLEGIPPFSPVFTNNSSIANQFSWSFGDGENSNETSPVHTYTDSGSFVISLVGITEFGCRDSLSKSINVIIPSYDVGVLSVFSEVNEGYLSASAQVVNYGSYTIDTITLNLTGEQGIQFRETWSGQLGSGQLLDFNFNSSVFIPDEKTPSYICVKISLPETKLDQNLSNNENCFTYDDAYQIIDPYPNPSNDRVIVGFNLPFEENVTLYLYNSRGSKMEKTYDGPANKGHNRIIIDVSKLDPGIYTYQLIIGDKVFSKRIMKSY